MLKALVFDQSTTVSGWASGTVDDVTSRKCKSGTIRNPKREHLGERLAYLHVAAAKLIEEHQPDMIGVEEPFFPVNMSPKVVPGGFVPASGFLNAEVRQEAAPVRGAAFNPDTIKALQMVKGTIITLAALYSLPCEVYAPASWRKTLLGIARAPKGSEDNIMKKLCRQRVKAMGYDTGSEDEAEAIGILVHALTGPEAAKRAQGDLLAMQVGNL